MTAIRHEVRIDGCEGFRSGIPAKTTALLLTDLGLLAASAVHAKLAARDAVRQNGPWAARAVELRVVCVELGDTASLILSAWPLGEIARGLYDGDGPWPHLPDPTGSSLDLAASAVADVAHPGEVDLDIALVRRIASMQRLFEGHAVSIEVSTTLHGGQRGPRRFVRIDRRLIEAARALCHRAPRALTAPKAPPGFSARPRSAPRASSSVEALFRTFPVEGTAPEA